MNRNIWYKIQLYILGMLLVGCASAPVSREPSTKKAESIYESITYRQSQKEDKLLRTDWAEEPYLSLEASYKYPLPYIPYFFSNFILVNVKEVMLVMASPFVGGTQYQDNFDDWLRRSALSYEGQYNGMWTDNRASYINMDQSSSLSEMESLPGYNTGRSQPGNTSGQPLPGNTSGQSQPENTSGGQSQPGNTSGQSVPGNASGK